MEKYYNPQFRTLKKLPPNINFVRPNVKTNETDDGPINLSKETASPVIILDEEISDGGKSLDSSQLNVSDKLKTAMDDNNINENLNSKLENKKDSKDDINVLTNDDIEGTECKSLVRKNECSLEQNGKNRRLLKSVISRIMAGLRVFEALMAPPTDDDNVVVETIDLRGEDEPIPDPELVAKLVRDQSVQNKILLQRFYGSLFLEQNKDKEMNNENMDTPNIDKMHDISNIINQVLVNPDDKIDGSSTNMSNSNQSLVIDRAEKGPMLPNFSPISEHGDAGNNNSDQEPQEQEPARMPAANKHVPLSSHYKQFAAQMSQQHHQLQQQLQQQQKLQHIHQLQQQYQHFMQENATAVSSNHGSNQQQPFRPDMQAAGAYARPDVNNNGLMMAPVQMPSAAQQHPYAATPWNPPYPPTPTRTEHAYPTGPCFYPQAPKVAAPTAPGFASLPVPAISPSSQRAPEIPDCRWQKAKPAPRAKRTKATSSRTEHSPYVRPAVQYDNSANDRIPHEQHVPASSVTDRRPSQMSYQQMFLEHQKKMAMLQQKQLQSMELHQRSWETPAANYPNSAWAQAADHTSNRRNY